MGVRTFPLIAVGSAAYVLISLSVLRDNLEAQSRIIQGLITGIGFVGGGAILKDPTGFVQGTATAVAYGQYDIAVIINLINYLTLRIMTNVKNSINGN